MIMLLFSQQIFAAMPPQIPLEDFFKNPEKSAYQISPDGKFISFMAPYESRMNIFVQKAGSEKATRITSETDRDIAGYYWANDNRILFLKDRRKKCQMSHLLRECSYADN